MEEEEAEEEGSTGGAIMALLWLGLLDAALLTVLIGYAVGYVRAAQKGTFSIDHLLGVLPWLVILGVVAFFVSRIFVGVLKNLISMFREGKKDQQGSEE